jgi:hypothetical protein
MALPATLIGAATGLSRLNEALIGIANGMKSAGDSLRALDSREVGIKTVFDLFGPGSQNVVEAEIMRRLFAVAPSTHAGPRTVFDLTGPGSQNLIEAEIQRRQHTRTGTQAGLVGHQSAAEAAMFLRFVTVTIKRV